MNKSIKIVIIMMSNTVALVALVALCTILISASIAEPDVFLAAANLDGGNVAALNQSVIMLDTVCSGNITLNVTDIDDMLEWGHVAVFNGDKHWCDNNGGSRLI